MITDTEIYQKQGFAKPVGFGSRPALVLIDFTNGFRDPDQFGGGNVELAIANAMLLLATARQRELPVAHTRIVYAQDGSDAGVLTLKVPSLRALTEANPASHIIPELTPVPGELVIRKTVPSAFSGTQLHAWLTSHHADTLVIAGVTTSGCVRATAVDSVSLNFKTVVAADACSDRHRQSHDNSLFDLEQKYADVLTTTAIRGLLAGAPQA